MINRRSFLTLSTIAALSVAAGPALAQQARIKSEDLRRAFERRDARFRRSAQTALKNAGFYKGRIDGAWGPGTASAYTALMSSERYRRQAKTWTASREDQVNETLTFLTSNAHR